MSIASFSALKDHVRTLPPAGLAVAGGNDPDVVRAVIAALEAGMIDRAIMSGDPALMAPMVPAKWLDHVRLVKGGDATECARHAVSAVRVGEADILMKGHVDSTSYLRAVVDGETGIRGDGVLSNITVASMPSYPKLLVVTDNGIVPIPTLEQKRQIILNTRPFFSGMGISPIRVAAIAATEKVSDRLPATIDANALAEESRANGLPGFIVDGPFGYDVAVSKASAEKKGLGHSPVAGNADLIICPQSTRQTPWRNPGSCMAPQKPDPSFWARRVLSC
ncbi:MAG: hypothetical protein KDJ90_02700 [Nitratireductor sp.]|nr:hypothetical protein [Nitratireductor sp.]